MELKEHSHSFEIFDYAFATALKYDLDSARTVSEVKKVLVELIDRLTGDHSTESEGEAP
jgi:hypothetical protein